MSTHRDRRITRRLATGALAVLLAGALAACGSLPTSGPVTAGRPISEGAANDNLVFLPDGPTAGASPEQIVEGFIAAGSGPQGNWETAKEFLAPGAEWNPRAGVVIYSPGKRSLQELSEGEFTLSVTPVATVDASGELLTSADAGEMVLPFTLAQQDDGEWRITSAPAGIVLDRARFTTVYGSYSLQFFDPSWSYLVPDERWFPRLYAATNIVEALVDGGPSAWLEQAVVTAFTDGARLAPTALPLRRSSVATVLLQEGARGLDPAVLNRMQTQLAASLDTAGVTEVDMLVGEQPLPAEGVNVISTNVDPRPLVQSGGVFGFLSGGTATSLQEIPGLSPALVDVSARDIEVNAARTLAAVRDASGAVVRVSSDGTVTRLEERAGLLAPSIDPFGYIWTVPQSAPSDVRAYSVDSAEISVAEAWPGTSEVYAQRVSRDGTRLAAIVRVGDAVELWVSGIHRDRSGAPAGLGERRVLAVLPGPTSALSWVDASSVAVIATDNGDYALYTQDVGGFGVLKRAPADVVAAAGGSQSGSVRLRDSSGELYGQRGANWQHLASGVDVLAIQQGSPR